MSVRYWALWVLPLELNKLLIIVAKPTEVANFDALVILGFGQMSQVLANFLHLVNLDSQVPILYGDGSRAALLESAGISSPKAVMVMYEGRQRAVKAVERIRLAFPAVIYFGLLQTSLQLGSSKLLKGLGIMSDDVSIN
ncbi:K(+) efflux antiporter 3, chloroplastic [Tanacetum coccineum]